ncbi:MAG: hypothetical protein IT458_10345 [Planctomycetes bacterium]|nr:hypothetical protein [Planctomycetota bacterium]
MNRVSPLPAALLAGLVCQGATCAQDFASPAERLRFEGNQSTIYPLGRFHARVQQLHGDLPAQPLLLRGQAYRRDATEVRGTILAFQSELSVTLSVTSQAPGQASTTFANNVGASPVAVVPRTRLSFPATDRPGQDPAPEFAHRIPYAVPFPWPGAGTLCVDITVFGNATNEGNDRNFVPLLDAHDTGPGRNEQPGFRYGSGCRLGGASGPAGASFTLRLGGGGLDLEAGLANGMPAQAGITPVNVLLVGATPVALPWPGLPGCTVLTSSELALPLQGTPDARGAWSGVLRGIQGHPAGTAWYLQIASVDTTGGALVLSDASRVVVPPLTAASNGSVRVANGTDRAAPTGTVASQVAVTRFLVP